MKTLKPILALLFCVFYSNSYSQNQIHNAFSETGYTWRCYHSCYLPGNPWKVDRAYTVLKDTTINNLPYKIVGVPGWAIGYFRTDTVNKVYFINTTDYETRNEVLLYDFSLIKGDSALIGGEMHAVDSVDTMYSCGEMRKRLFFYNMPYYTDPIDVWIDGIGSYKGPAGTSQISIDLCINSLLCNVKKNDTLIFNQADGFIVNGYCSALLGIEQQAISTVKTYPNPASSFFTIEYPDTATINSVLKIYNITGTEIKQAAITNEQSNIDCSKLENGVYLWQLHTNGRPVQQGKIIIVK